MDLLRKIDLHQMLIQIFELTLILLSFCVINRGNDFLLSVKWFSVAFTVFSCRIHYKVTIHYKATHERESHLFTATTPLNFSFMTTQFRYFPHKNRSAQDRVPQFTVLGPISSSQAARLSSKEINKRYDIWNPWSWIVEWHCWSWLESESSFRKFLGNLQNGERKK